MYIIKLSAIVLFILLTACFVAIEFSIVKARRSRINQLIEENVKGAKAAKHVITHLDEYLSACQLGITVTALGIGWLGEPTVKAMLQPLFLKTGVHEAVAQVLSLIIAFLLVTYVNVVIGELAPKSFAIQKAERITLLSARPMILFYKLMFPFIWLLNHSARLITAMFGLKPASEHEMAYTEEELRVLLAESYRSGMIKKSELHYVNNIFTFDKRTAKEIMVPRNEMVSLPLDSGSGHMLRDIIKTNKYTRYPVVKGDKDHVVGIINIKEVLFRFLSEGAAFTKHELSPYIQPAIHVIETIPIYQLFVKMQREHAHMAILIDEYGGTAGLVTAEDIIEEIVGEIRDEFDTDETPSVQKLGKNRYLLNAKLLISEVNDVLGTEITADQVDTLGGWFLTQHIDAKPGSTIDFEGYTFTVKEIDSHHIITIEADKAE
ncbi:MULTISPECIES: hemolysin family protein [Bacillus]|uniref:hemolysin family protein n=1 Tax=Bacillus TaxID=1386 RepID=UPI0002AAD7F5|nr:MULTISPECIES: hemolysin family protein [Bacillus amyloliquefaciens group]AVB08349.1 HlyC/CorC family transporter [Bacillus velezensis]AYV16257.1 HlyC/CorC family transporter [Bacillus velezensis]MCR6614258.1 hemolysin family protein [Bacillus amyloliquefaciens]MCV2521834.1 hemolysin family protein [Bacillus velezensis]MEC0405395.1 hemolysin family protein [Bacillus velezensis]